MLTTRWVCNLAETLPGVTVKDHFGSDAYRANERIFATVWHEKNEVNLKLSLEDQRRFLSLDGEGFVEIDNGWGRMGFTKVQLAYVDRKEFEEALRSAWANTARKTARKPAKKSTKKRARN